MKILIFEGIATSGKSTVISRLEKRLAPDYKTRVYTEEFTHIPIKDKPKELHTDYFMNLVTDAMHAQYDIVFFDRLYLTQAFRADVELAAYADLEMTLFVNQVETIFLDVAEDQIQSRIEHAVSHRNTAWGEYVSTKGTNLAERATYYITQQRRLQTLLGSSLLPHESFEVIAQDYDWIVEELVKRIRWEM